MDLIEECNKIINELTLFSSDMIFLGSTIEDDRIEEFEKRIGFVLPIDFKYMLKKHNGIVLSGIEIFGLGSALKEASLDKIYEFEHSTRSNLMPSYFLPFSPDGRGNHYCFNLSKINNGLCPAVFWQWDFKYNSYDDIEECNESLISWMKEVMIGWTLENYNYDGSEKE